MRRPTLFSTCVTASGALLAALWMSVPVRTAPAAAPARSAAAATQTAPAKPATSAAQAAAPGDYVGEATCLGCHEDAKKGYHDTLHGKASLSRSPKANHGCESCHGAGKAHADSGDATLILNPKKLSPQKASEACVSCHTKGSHALWAGSQHDQRNVGCVTCHSVHASKGPSQLKTATEGELCQTCHKNVTNKLHRFNHMPVREGKMQCASCHNPHGSTNQKLLKTGTTVDQSCTSCHAEKRGPYLWEHAPVANSCVTCHDPHGSNNDRMLAAKVPTLCQRCHVTSRHPPTVYDKFVLNNSTNANKIFGRGCVSCHAQIHGSNAPSGKSFLR